MDIKFDHLGRRVERKFSEHYSLFRRLFIPPRIKWRIVIIIEVVTHVIIIFLKIAILLNKLNHERDLCSSIFSTGYSHSWESWIIRCPLCWRKFSVRSRIGIVPKWKSDFQFETDFQRKKCWVPGIKKSNNSKKMITVFVYGSQYLYLLNTLWYGTNRSYNTRMLLWCRRNWFFVWRSRYSL